MLRLLHIGTRTLACLWALPNTVLGAVAAACVLAFGGRLRFVEGAAEVCGGRVARLVAGHAYTSRFSAMTLGHVILGVSEEELDRVRFHEHVHVGQYERWGPFFLPAYALSSLWQLARGGAAYRANRFERQAYAADAERERLA